LKPETNSVKNQAGSKQKFREQEEVDKDLNDDPFIDKDEDKDVVADNSG